MSVDTPCAEFVIVNVNGSAVERKRAVSNGSSSTQRDARPAWPTAQRNAAVKDGGGAGAVGDYRETKEPSLSYPDVKEVPAHDSEASARARSRSPPTS